MSSCENSTVIHEPVVEPPTCLEILGEPVSEQQSCMEEAHTSFDSMVGPKDEPDLYGPTINDTSVKGIGDTVAMGDGLVVDSESINVRILGETFENNCGISEACLNENQGDICNSEDGNVSVEEGGSQGENNLVSLLDGCEMNLEVTATSDSLSNCVQPDEQNKDEDISLVAEQVKDLLEVECNISAGVETSNGDLISSSRGCEMSYNHSYVDCLPSQYSQKNGMDEKNVCGISSGVVDEKAGSAAEISASVGDHKPSTVASTGIECNHDSVQKYEERMSSFTSERVIEVSDVQTNPGTSMQVVSPECCQSSMKEIRLDDSLAICAKPNVMLDDATVSGPSVEITAQPMEDNSDSNGDQVTECNQDSDQQYEDIVTSFSAERLIEVSDVKSNLDTTMQVASPQCYQISMEEIQFDDSLAICAQQNGMLDDKTVSGSSVGITAQPMEGTSNSTSDTKVDNGKSTLLVEENPSNLKDSSSTGAPSCIVEKFASLLSCQPFDVASGSSSKIVDATNIYRNDDGFINSSSNACFTGQTDDSVKDPGVYVVSETVASSTGRSGQKSKPRKKALNKRDARRSKASKVLPPHVNFEIILEGARRKRSCVSKPARSSLWGSSACKIQFFEQSNLHGLSQIQTPGSRKPRDGRGSAKRNGNKASGRARGSMKESRGKSSASTSRIHLKVKFGKGVDENCLNFLVPGDVYPKLSAKAVSSSNGSESYSETNLELLKLTNSLEVKRSEDGTLRELDCFSKNPLMAKAHIDASESNDHPAKKESYSTVMIEKSTEEHLDNYSGTCTEASEPLERASVTGCLDPGTSPDSEVINPVSDAQVGGSYQELQNSALTSAQDFVAPENKIDKKKEKFSFPASRNRAKSSKKHGSGDEFFPTDIGIGFSESKTLKGSVPVKAARQKPSKSSKSSKSSKGRSKASEPGKRGGNTHKQMENQHKSVTERKAKEYGVSDSVVSNADNAEIGNSIVDTMGKTIIGDNIASIESPNLNVVQGFSSEQYVQPRNAWVLCDDCQKWRRIAASLVDSIGQENCTWTCKDSLDKAFADCSIPQEKSNAEINMELEISDGSGDEDASNSRRSYRKLEYQRPTVSQEHAFKRIDTNQFLHRSRKTQTIDEIMVCHCKPPQDGRLGCGDECLNRMLNIECVRGTCPCGDRCSNQQFQKRKYAKLEWFRSGKKGYGLQSTEDISQGQFLIEYVGEVLDMNSYEARQKEYALNGHRHFYFMTLNGSEVIDACAKGNLGRFINHSCEPNCRTEKWMVNGEICIGLFAVRNIKKGEEVTFDYNYVRVFGAAAKKCYCGSSQCQGYIGGDPQNSEVIVESDSDEEFPEPVMLGENGKMGHSKSRRATLSDHVEMHTVGSITEGKDKIDQSITAIRQLEIKAERDDPLNLSSSTLTQLHSSLEFEDSKAKESTFIRPHESSQQIDDVTSKPMTCVEQDISAVEETSEKMLYSGERVESSCPLLLEETLTNGTDSDQKTKSDTIEDKQVCSKKFPRVKTSRKEGSYGKVKVDNNSLYVNTFKVTSIKSHTLSIKPKKLMEGTPSRFEAVEGKLNELLDADGGISKRKDAPKGYLKLLLLTAASGDSGNSEAIQSNRDLSMILDAILKTKSRAVLIDIISKNGLQMLHKMMKQYRRDFKKIPILRKLLKVFEHMAAKEILTSEQITAGPPCLGMESFRESILSLTEHNDKQVHQIARKFRDRWIPRPLRKIGESRMDIHRGPNCNRLSAQRSYQHEQDIKPTEAIVSLNPTMPPTFAVDPPIPGSSSEAQASGDKNNGTTTRKRKSRWDQPADPNKALKVESSGQATLDNVNKVKREETSSSFSSLCQQQGEAMMIDTRIQDIYEDGPPGFLSIPEDAPPGFSCPLVSHPVSANASATTTSIGYPQERFIYRLPVSYGIPFSIVQQFGIPEHENSESWTIAPGIPFHPFPPLPPYPLDKKTHPYCDAIIKRPLEEGKRDSIETHSCNYSDDTSASTSADQSDMNTSSACNHEILKPVKELSTDLGKRYFRQQRWNGPKVGPPWKRNSWGHPYSRIRNGNIANENISSHCEDKVSYKGDNLGSDIYHHHTQNQNQH